MNNLAEVYFVGLGVRGNHVRYPVTVVIPVGLGGAKTRGGDSKATILSRESEGASHKQMKSFLWGELTPLYTMREVITM